VEWEVTDWDKETGQATNAEAEVWFTAQTFHCQVCGLRLDSEARGSAKSFLTFSSEVAARKMIATRLGSS
jgi:hypothetical protein